MRDARVSKQILQRRAEEPCRFRTIDCEPANGSLPRPIACTGVVELDFWLLRILPAAGKGLYNEDGAIGIPLALRFALSASSAGGGADGDQAER